jgi:hypothetical protein
MGCCGATQSCSASWIRKSPDLCGFGRKPRVNRWRGHHARRPYPYTSAVAGRTKLPWRRRERQPDRSAAGGHPHFFGSSWIWVQTAGQPMARSPRAAPVSIHVGRRGALNPFLGLQGTVEGSKRGRGPSAFFRDTFPASAPRDPPFRLHSMRDPANRPLARDPANALALSRAQGSQDRASGFVGLGSGALAAGRRRREGTRMAG